MPNIYFASDHHFDHPKILGFTARGKKFNSIQEMNQAIIREHNKVVRKDDVVIIVGDFSMNWKPDRIRELLSKMNGTKILVVGNHDKVDTLSGLNMGFALVVRSLDIVIAKHTVTVCHYPPRFNSLTYAWRKFWGKWVVPDWHKRPSRYFLKFYIHGHTHSENMYKGRFIHVGIDATKYCPTPLSRVEAYINKYIAKNFCNNTT